MSTVTATKTKTYDLAYIAIFAVLIAICSWISIPMTVPFTLQTFGVFMAVGVLGGKRGSLAVLVYILLGAIGVPVFAGFSGGLGILLNNTGGYIIGFLFSALVMWAMESLWGKKPVIQILSMVVGLIVCYAMGTIWFMVVYTRTSGAVGLGTVLGWCVIPFIIPDLVKIALAFVLSRRVRKLVPMQQKRTSDISHSPSPRDVPGVFYRKWLQHWIYSPYAGNAGAFYKRGRCLSHSKN